MCTSALITHVRSVYSFIWTALWSKTTWWQAPSFLFLCSSLVSSSNIRIFQLRIEQPKGKQPFQRLRGQSVHEHNWWHSRGFLITWSNSALSFPFGLEKAVTFFFSFEKRRHSQETWTRALISVEAEGFCRNQGGWGDNVCGDCDGNIILTALSARPKHLIDPFCLKSKEQVGCTALKRAAQVRARYRRQSTHTHFKFWVCVKKMDSIFYETGKKWIQIPPPYIKQIQSRFKLGTT